MKYEESKTRKNKYIKASKNPKQTSIKNRICKALLQESKKGIKSLNKCEKYNNFKSKNHEFATIQGTNSKGHRINISVKEDSNTRERSKSGTV